MCVRVLVCICETPPSVSIKPICMQESVLAIHIWYQDVMPVLRLFFLALLLIHIDRSSKVIVSWPLTAAVCIVKRLSLILMNNNNNIKIITLYCLFLSDLVPTFKNSLLPLQCCTLEIHRVEFLHQNGKLQDKKGDIASGDNLVWNITNGGLYQEKNTLMRRVATSSKGEFWWFDCKTFRWSLSM